MSDTIEVDTVHGARRPRPAMDRTMTEGDPVVVEGDGGAITPEDALAEAQRVIREYDHLQQQLVQEQQARTRAEREAQRAQVGRQQDRGAVLAAAVEAATSAQAQAEAAVEAARESGDIKAEIAANKALLQATFRLEAANAQLSQAQTRGDPTSSAGSMEQPQQQAVSSAAQAWIGRHPRFNSDPHYRATLLAAHGAAVNDGLTPDSPAYFRELDRVAATLEGNDQGGSQVSDNSRPSGSGNQQFSGASPTRGGGGAGGNSSVVRTMLGDVTVTRRPGGKIGVQVPPHLKADFEEGAKISGMQLGDYIYEQVEIARERQGGGTGGLITEEGRTFR